MLHSLSCVPPPTPRTAGTAAVLVQHVACLLSCMDATCHSTTLWSTARVTILLDYRSASVTCLPALLNAVSTLVMTRCNHAWLTLPTKWTRRQSLRLPGVLHWQAQPCSASQTWRGTGNASIRLVPKRRCVNRVGLLLRGWLRMPLRMLALRVRVLWLLLLERVLRVYLLPIRVMTQMVALALWYVLRVLVCLLLLPLLVVSPFLLLEHMLCTFRFE